MAMIRTAALGAALALGACAGSSPKICTVYDAARDAACATCAALSAQPCPFARDAEVER